MRSKRSHDKYAPILTDSKYGTEQRKSYTHKPVEKVEWKPSDYTKSLHDSFFGKWGLDD